MRLIDADEQIRILESIKKKAESNGNEVVFSVNNVIKFFNDSTTAYSVENVIEELEKQRNIIFQDTDSEIKIVRANAWDKIDVLNKAIEIVKQGGVRNESD